MREATRGSLAHRKEAGIVVGVWCPRRVEGRGCVLGLGVGGGEEGVVGSGGSG